MKTNRLLWPLLGLTLAAGCFAGPMPAPASGSWAPGGHLASASSLGHTNLSFAPAAVATVETVATQTANSAGRPAAPQPTQAVLPESSPGDAPAPEAAAVPAVSPSAASPAPAAEPASRVPILEYHYSRFEMLPTVIMRPEWFRAQMQWLSQAGFHTLSSAELARFVAGTQPGITGFE